MRIGDRAPAARAEPVVPHPPAAIVIAVPCPVGGVQSESELEDLALERLIVLPGWRARADTTVDARAGAIMAAQHRDRHLQVVDRARALVGRCIGPGDHELSYLVVIRFEPLNREIVAE